MLPTSPFGQIGFENINPEYSNTPQKMAEKMAENKAATPVQNKQNNNQQPTPHHTIQPLTMPQTSIEDLNTMVMPRLFRQQPLPITTPSTPSLTAPTPIVSPLAQYQALLAPQITPIEAPRNPTLPQRPTNRIIFV
jgi:hypothetical protein